MGFNERIGAEIAIEKLVAVCAQAVGHIALPWLVRRTAEAKAYEIKVLHEWRRLELKAIDERLTGGSSDLRYPIGHNSDSVIAESVSAAHSFEARVRQEAAMRQANLENITAQAFALLKDLRREKVSSQPVEVDWIVEFFGRAQDVSGSESQASWAKMLANEIQLPGSVPLRTIESRKPVKEEPPGTQAVAGGCREFEAGFTLGRKIWTATAETREEGARDVSKATIDNADRFGSLLEVDAIFAVDISVAYNGRFIFDWRKSNELAFTVSIGPRPVITYSAIFGENDSHDTLPLGDYLPEVVKQGILQVVRVHA